MLLTQKTNIFPFSAIVGQEMMKEALLLNVIDPTIGGVLIRGKKGSAKSTACRALKSLFGKEVPFITLPLSATEDMIVGSIDFQEVLKSGRKEVSYGILNKVNNGILYIDEVNLLNSHLVELLLDAASFGINRIEREGISFEHASKFILIGTMNPEEGEVSPQFLDRFGLSVSIDNELNIDNRVLILQRREEFDKDPDAFISHFRSEEKRLAEKLKESKILVKQIIMTDDHRKLVTEIVLKNNCAGHRAEIIMSKTARAICTFENRDTVTIEDIQKAAAFVLPHRTREQKEPETNPSRPSDKKENNKQDNKNQERNKDNSRSSNNGGEDNNENNATDQESNKNNSSDLSAPPSGISSQSEINFETGELFNSRKLNSKKDRIFRKGSGRRSHTKTKQKVGRYVKSIMYRQDNDIALDATLRAAALHQKDRGRNKNDKIIIKDCDIRSKSRKKKTGNFILFVVDASGSMGAYRRMVETKGAVMSLLMDAYQKRDKVGLIAFRRDKAECLVFPASSIELAGKQLQNLATGGKTPLTSALELTGNMLQTAFAKDKTVRPIVIFISDGKTNISNYGSDPLEEAFRYAVKLSDEFPAKYVVIDTESNNGIKLGLAKNIARRLNAEYYQINDLKADSILNISREVMQL